jgi:hypothetical protein
MLCYVCVVWEYMEFIVWVIVLAVLMNSKFRYLLLVPSPLCLIILWSR